MTQSVRELLIKVTVDASGANGNLDSFNDKQDQSTTKSTALGAALGGMAVKLAETAVAAAKAGAVFLSDLVFGTAKAADEIAKTSKQLGIAADGLQRLRGAAALSGADTATLDKGIRTLTKGLADAAQKGTGPAAEALETLGLEVADLESLLQDGDIEGTMGVIGDAFNATGDSAEKNAALLRLLGGAGSKLRPLIESGTEGIAAMGEQLEATGSIIDAETLGQFESMEDSLFLLEKQAEGVKVQIASALAPAVSQIAGEIQGWVQENQDFIEQDLPELMEELGTLLIELARATLEVIKSWRELARDAGRLSDDLEGVGEGFGAVADGMNAVIGFQDKIADGFLDIAQSVAEALGVGEEFIAFLEELKKAGGVSRAVEAGLGAAGRAQGAAAPGEALVNPTDFSQAEQTGDTSKLQAIANDPRFSADDRATAGAAAGAINQRTALVTQGKAQADSARKAQENAARSSGRAPRRRGGGGGRGAAAAAASPAGPTVEELVSSVGGAGSEALRSASSALSGTILASVDNSVKVTQAFTVEVEVSAALDTNVGEETAEAVRAVVRDEVGIQNREVIEVITARRNVSP